MSEPERATVVDGQRVVDEEALLAYDLLVELTGSRAIADHLTRHAGGRRIPPAHQVTIARKRREFRTGQLDLFAASSRSGRQAARLAGLPEATWRRWRKKLAAAGPKKSTGASPAVSRRSEKK